MKIDPAFMPLLQGVGLKQIEESSDVIFIVDENYILRAFNRAWESFAHKNSGNDALQKYGLGSSVPDSFPEPLKMYYLRIFNKALSSGERMEFAYECSSDKVYRKCMQSLYPLHNRAGILISNHIEIEKPLNETPVEFAARHRDKEGIIVVCCHCRRTRDLTKKDKWDWIPDFVRSLPDKVSHGVCSRCVEFYYPSLIPSHQ